MVVILTVALTPQVSTAQSLAAVARQEQARRQHVPKAGKRYTNDSLTRDYSAPTPASPAAPDGAGAAAGTTAPAAEAAAAPEAPATGAAPGADSAKDEAYWRERIGSARSALERSKSFVEALQSRINALTTDFVNRDDPAQRAAIEQNRLKAIAELERTQREIVQNTKAIADIEEEARKAGVPAGWLR